VNANALITELEHVGVHLWLDGNKLRFRGPRGVMSQERREQVAAQRDEIIQLLRQQALPEPIPQPDACHEPFPLTDVQAAYLLGRVRGNRLGGVGCHSYMEISFRSLDVDRLEGAWQTVIDHHPMLRAVILQRGEQRVLPEVPRYRIAVTDLRGADREACQSHLTRTRAEIDHTVYVTHEWPLFTLRITRLPDQDILHLSIDMLIADFVSIQLLLADLDRSYSGVDTDEPRVTFRDYVLAHRQLPQHPEWRRDRSYWLDRIDTLPSAPELPAAGDGAPVAGPAPVEDSQPRFTRRTLRLSPQSWSALREAGRSHGLTPSGTLLSAYAEVIGRWSRHDRFSLNVTLQGRLPLHPDIDAVVGDFTSVIPLAVDHSAATYVERAMAVQNQLADDLDHRMFSGIEVLRELGRRHGSETALMPVVFTSALGLARTTELGTSRAEGTAGGLMTEATSRYGISQTPQVHLDCQVLEDQGALVVNWDVRDGAYPPVVIEDMFAAFKSLLHVLAGRPPSTEAPSDRDPASLQAWELQCPIPVPESQQRARENLNRITTATAPGPDAGLVHSPLLAAARRTPDAPAIIAPDTTLTYQELVSAAAQLATLIPDHDSPVPVAVALDKGAAQITAVIAVLLAGRPYLPLDPRQPATRQTSILEDAAVDVLLTDGTDPHTWPDALTAIPIDRIPALGTAASVPAEKGDPNALAYVIYTSGSTGHPKGVAVSHRAVRATLDDIVDRFQLHPQDRVLGLSGLSFDLSVFDLFGTFAAGAALVLPEPHRRGDPARWAQLIDDHAVSVINSVPAQPQMLIQYLRSQPESRRPRLASVRLIMMSGDWIPTSLPSELSEVLPQAHQVSLGGATEASIWSIFHPIAEVLPHWRSIPYGVPLLAHSFAVRDEHGHDQPDWVPGELWIGGDALATGYFRDPDLTAARFVTDPLSGARMYRTGDIGRYLPGGIIEFLGREDQQVKIRGHRIELAEVEMAMQAFAPVTSAAVIVDGNRALERRLIGFYTSDHQREAAVPYQQLAADAKNAASRILTGTDPDRLAEFADRMDRAARLSMACTLRELGLFSDPEIAYNTEGLLTQSGATPANRRVVRRWLRVLAADGLVTRTPEGDWTRLTPVTRQDVQDAWDSVEQAHHGLDDGAELITFLRSCAQRLADLVRGEDSALSLLFPHGDIGTAEAAYKDNIISRYVNQAVTAVMRTLADQHTGTLRVLEVGAGVGGTTADVVTALAGTRVDYLFTDLSRFFLTDAQQQFSDVPGMRYGLFDINADLAGQDVEPGSYDVILCANVLHNAVSADVVIDRLRTLLVPGGRLVFIETVRENTSVMMSMEFLMTFDDTTRPDFADARHGRDRIFLTRDEWLDVLRRAGGAIEVCLPDDRVMEQFGQAVFCVRFGSDADDVQDNGLGEWLSERLPEPMVPSRLIPVDALPLTANGKVDRSALAARVPRSRPAAIGASDAPHDDLERRLTAIWAELLGLEGVGRSDDFFALGGDSLLIARLAEKLRTSVPEASGITWEALIPELMSRPTIMDLAAQLRRADSPQPLRVLRGTSATSERRRVLVHDGSAPLLPYRSLIASLVSDTPLLGLAPPRLDDYLACPTETLVTGLAREYAELLAGGPPVELIGYCMGGMTALELARELRRRGTHVQRLIVIGSHRVPYLVEEPGLVEYGYARLRGIDPTAVGLPTDPGAVGHEVRAALDRHGLVPKGSLDAVLGSYLAATRTERLSALATQTGNTIEQLEQGLAVFTHSITGVVQWRPDPYDGPVEFLSHASDAPFLPGVVDEPIAFWRELCGSSLTIHDIPGDHFACLHEPHVDTVAAWIEHRDQQAES
jgi:amino acid adenylation domain